MGTSGKQQSALLACLLASIAGSASAACTVDGGGPLQDGAFITCSGSSPPLSLPGLNGLSITVLAGSTVGSESTSPAIRIGSGFIAVQTGAQVIARTFNAQSSVIEITNASPEASSYIDNAGRILRASGSATGVGIRAPLNTLIANSGELDSTNGSPAIINLTSGSVRTVIARSGSLTNFGSVRQWLGTADLGASSLFNEESGRIELGVQVAPAISNLGGTGDLISIVNKGYIGSSNPLLLGLQNGLPDPLNLDVSNESGAVIESGLRLPPAPTDGISRLVNRGTLRGSIMLAGTAIEAGQPVGGRPSLLENLGRMEATELNIIGGRFVQGVGASSVGAPPIWLVAIDGGGVANIGELELRTSLSSRCVSSVTQDVFDADEGGAVLLSAQGILEVAPVEGEVCAFNGYLEGAGRVIKSGAGEWVLGPPQGQIGSSTQLSSFSGGTELQAGVLTPLNRAALGTGALRFNGVGARLRLQQDQLLLALPLRLDSAAEVELAAGGLELQGGSSGAGRLFVNGEGSLRLAGGWTHSGGTQIQDVMIELAGSHQAELEVGSGALLGGGGNLVGRLRVLDAGAVVPALGGAATVQLSVGGLELETGSTLAMTVDANGNDRVLVTGEVRLAGARLELLFPQGLSLPLGSTRVLIENDGSDVINGGFENLAEGGVVRQGDNFLRVSYRGGSGNDLSVTAVEPEPVFADGFESPSAGAP